MKKSAAIFLFLLFALSGVSQNYIPYHNLVREAEALMYQRQFEEAAEKYYAAFALEEALPRDSYRLVYCLDQMDPIANELEMKRWLLHTSTRTWRLMNWVNEMPLSVEYSELLYYDFRLNAEDYKKRVKPVLDTLMYFVMPGEMRTLFMDSIRVYYMNIDPKYVLYKRLMQEEDSLRQIEILEYIRNEGYPGERISGAGFASQSLRRMPANLYEEFVEVLFEELKRGNMRPYEYGWMIDRFSIENEGRTTYYLRDYADDSEPNFDEIRENRKEIGMSLYFRYPSRGINLFDDEMILLGGN